MALSPGRILLNFAACNIQTPQTARGQMWQYDEPKNGILQVSIDRLNKPVNSFSIETMNQLRDVAAFVAGRPDIKTVIFQSGKPSNFLAGADLYEIRENATFDATLKMSRNGHSAFQAIEELEATTIAAIHGVALGGGLEFAMCCDFRIASNDPRTQLGLPEVFLGLIPGWGATVRLPKLVGFDLATDMLLSGRSLLPAEALEAGLVDEVVPADQLEKAARKLAESELPDRSRAVDVAEVQRTLSVATARQLETTQGAYPAPLKMIEVLREGLERSDEEKYDLEANGIATLAPDPVTEELIRLFFLKEASKKPPADIKQAVREYALKAVGVVSDGTYGESIALMFARAGVKTGLANLGETDSATAAPSAENLTRTSDVYDLGDSSVVIEAVVDDLDAERGLFLSLGTVVHPESTIASTSASFVLREQASGVPQPERLIGLRFFSPVTEIPLVEIVRQEDTSANSLAAAFAITRRLGKNTVLVKDSPGFLVNRLLMPYLTEAGYLLTELSDPDAVQREATEFGMTQSPLQITDILGLRVAAAISKRLHLELTEHLPASPIWLAIRDSDQPDMKFLTEEGQLNPAVREIIDRLVADSPSVDDPPSIINRLIYPMINAGASCLAEGVVSSADEIDLALILAGGFPAFRGGPMQYGLKVGLQNICLLYTSPSPRDQRGSRMPSSA